MTSSAHTVLGYLHSILSRPRGEADDDRELLRRFTDARDGDAFAVLMRRHGPMVLGLAGRVVGDAQLAEDVFQAAFLMLARKAHTIRRAESLSCWLHGVAFRLALRVRRSHQRRQERESRVRSSPPPSPLDELTAQELLAVLDEELHQLPEKYRAALILCCLEGLSQEEAAGRLGCSAGVVKGRLERGRNQLRRRLEKRGLTLPAVLGGTLLLTGSAKAVPAVLIQATLQAATTGAGAKPAAVILIEEAMRSMLVHKLKAIGAAVILLALSGTGAGMMALRPQAAKENTTLPVVDDKTLSRKNRVDLYGDPLPDGAVMRLGTLQRRAVGAKLAVTPDGKSIVAVRAGMYVHVWDAATGKRLHKHQLSADPADLTEDSWLSSDGRMLLTGLSTGEGRLQLWDLQTGKQVRTLSMEGATNIWPAILSAEGKWIAAAGSTGKKGHRIQVWERATGRVIFTKEIRESTAIQRLLFTPDGKRLLVRVNGKKHTLICWDLAGRRRLWETANYYCPNAMVCTPDGKLLTNDKPPVLDLATGQSLSHEKPLTTDGESVFHLALSPDGRTLFASTYKKVIIWDRVEGKVVRTLPVGGDFVVWPDGKSILTNAAALQRWDVDSGKPLYTDTFSWGHTAQVGYLAWSTDGRRLASKARDGTLRLWDAKTGRPLRIQRDRKTLRPVDFQFAMKTGDKLLDFSPDGRWLLSNAWGEDCLKMWEADTGKEIRSLPFPARGNGEGARQVFRARIASDGTRAVAVLGSQTTYFVQGVTPPRHKVCVWDTKAGRLLTCHPIDGMQWAALALAPDGRTAVSDDTLIDTATGKERGRLEGKESNFARYPVTFSRDGALVAGAVPRITRKGKNLIETFPDGVRIWETATGKSIAHVNTKSWPADLAFSPNNRFLATSGPDGIRIWDVQTGKLAVCREMPEKVPGSHRGDVFARCFAFSAEGRLATGHPDSTILVWDVPLPASKAQRLETKELEALWTDLADSDAAKAWRAVWRLADAPNDALPFLRGRVRPSPIAPADVTRKLLANLDSDSFAVRQAAEKRLKELDLQAEPALRAALKAKPSLEQRRRIEELLTALPLVPSPPSPEELRQLRALIVLERIGTPEARRLLEKIAKGPESARLTRQAQAALMCLR